MRASIFFDHTYLVGIGVKSIAVVELEIEIMTRRMKPDLIFLIMLFILSLPLFAQRTQTLRGQVTDQLLNTPLAGATVELLSQKVTVLTDAEGNFRFSKIPIGTHQLRVTHTGYSPVQFDNIMLISGKEKVMTILLEKDIKEEQEVVVKARALRSKPLNELSVVSARAFTVEETQRYAAAVNDPLRMATSFAGVIGADDGNNHIVIRGNAPNGLLWRMEGVDIPNPNHFAAAGSSGGGISILSSQLLANSDFVTGAFAAEYGNALSGVFDLKLRKGNNEKKEYTLQAGFLGLNLAAEGPFAKNYKGSYLVNYRYSTLELLSKMGLDMGGATTNFQDLSYHLYLPTKRAGSFTLFGFGGISGQEADTETDPSKWEDEGDRYGGTFKSNTGAMGITHTIGLGTKTTLRSSLAWSFQETGMDEDYVAKPDSIVNSYKEQFTTQKWILSSTISHQFNRRHALRAGLTGNLIDFSYFQRSRENPTAPVEERINTNDQAQTVQLFAQWQYKVSKKFSMTAGLHYLQLLLNNSAALEPRAGLKYEPDNRQSFGIGYGLHSQVQGMGVYFAKAPDASGNWYEPNKELGLTRAHHFVVSYSRQLGHSIRFKTELYYQHLFKVPVSIYDSSSLSTLNLQQGFVTDPLVNKGTGRNYGIELSLEKQLKNYFYFLFSNSLFQSKYSAADGIERNTRYNAGYAGSFTAGKEFVHHSNKRSYGVNIKMIYTGGFRETPIDLEASAIEGYTKYREKEAFTVQQPAYFRTDLRFSIRWNRQRHTSTLSLDIQNASNRKNLYGRYYDPFQGQVVNNYQTGLIPVLNYKIEL